MCRRLSSAGSFSQSALARRPRPLAPRMASSSRDAAAADKLTVSLTECVHTLANEPSLGLYYVCEHIQRAVPALVGHKQEVAQAGEQLHGADLDAAFAQEQMASAVSADTQSVFDSIQRLAATAAATAQRTAPK